MRSYSPQYADLREKFIVCAEALKFAFGHNCGNIPLSVMYCDVARQNSFRHAYQTLRHN
jgi:hypothetical protein